MFEMSWLFIILFSGACVFIVFLLYLPAILELKRPRDPGPRQFLEVDWDLQKYLESRGRVVKMSFDVPHGDSLNIFVYEDDLEKLLHGDVDKVRIFLDDKTKKVMST